MIKLLVCPRYNKLKKYEAIVRLGQNAYSLPGLSEDELARELALSIEKSNQGFTHSARQVSDEMRKKYAV